jgi:hypothetical protein
MADMVDVVIRDLLGNWGSFLLDTYLKYSLYINAAVLLYALLIILSRRNYRQIRESLQRDLRIRYQAQIKNKDHRSIVAMLDRNGIPWEQALSASKFPFIAHPRGLTIHTRSARNLQRMIPVNSLASSLAEPPKE